MPSPRAARANNAGTWAPPAGPPRVLSYLNHPGSLIPALVFIHWSSVDPFFSYFTRLGTSVMLALALYLWARYVQKKESALPWVPALALYVYLQHGIGALQPPLSVGVWKVAPRPASYDFATLLALLGEAAAIGGFHVFRSATKNRHVPLPSIAEDALGMLATVHLAIGAVVVALNGAPALRASFGLFLSVAFGASAVAVLTTLSYLTHPCLTSGFRMAAGLSLAVVSAYRSSMLSEAIFPLASAGLVWMVRRRGVPYAALGAILAIGVIVQPMKTHFRTRMWNPDSVGTTATEAWVDAFQETAFAEVDQRVTRAETGADAFARRVAEFGTLAYVVEMVPDRIPYGGGLSYGPALYGLIPRVIWPDKPDMTKAGTDTLAIALGISDPEIAQNSTTSVPLIHLGYFEHGLFGSLVWLFGYGACLGSVAMIGRRNGISGLLIEALMLVPMMYGYSSTLPAFLGSFQYLIAIILLLVGLATMSNVIARIGGLGRAEHGEA